MLSYKVPQGVMEQSLEVDQPNISVSLSIPVYGFLPLDLLHSTCE